jgi:hypothetical protein
MVAVCASYAATSTVPRPIIQQSFRMGYSENQLTCRLRPPLIPMPRRRSDLRFYPERLHLIVFGNDALHHVLTEQSSQHLRRIDALRDDLQVLGAGVGDCDRNRYGRGAPPQAHIFRS